jgi:threonine/homoserine/homoserine lactone efflux protein
VRDALPYALGIALSPVPIGAVLLLLTCRRAIANGLSFLLGWSVGVAALIVLLVTLVQAAGISDADPSWLAAADVLLGGLFLLASALVFRRRRGTVAGAAPWLAAVDGLSTRRSGALGLVLSTANPKVIALSLGAAIAVAGSGGAGTARLALAFTTVAAVGIAVPLAIYLAAPARSGATLARVRRSIERHEANVLVVLGLVVAVLFLADGVGRI